MAYTKKYEYECRFEDFLDDALNNLSVDDFTALKDSISMILCDYDDEVLEKRKIDYEI